MIEAQNDTVVQAGYRVLRRSSDTFFVDCDGVECGVKARGKLKTKGTILTGDYVVLSDDGQGGNIITGVLPRKNELSRPSIANVDLIIIVAAPVPIIDYALIDKLIVHCMRAGVDYAICCNKTDIGKQDLPFLRDQYRRACDTIVTASAISGEVDEIRGLIENKLTCFAGQSAVGKSSITNALLGGDIIKTGELSGKIGRGRNTTTAAQIYKLAENTYVADTPGFSLLDQAEIEPDELRDYYPEFERFADKCRFTGCRHLKEPGCAVRDAAEKGRINNERYARYKHMVEELIAERRKKH